MIAVGLKLLFYYYLHETSLVKSYKMSSSSHNLAGCPLYGQQEVLTPGLASYGHTPEASFMKTHAPEQKYSGVSCTAEVS